MFNNLQDASVQNASEEDVLAAMGGDPEGSGKQPGKGKDGKDGDPKSTGKKPAEKTTKSSSKTGTSTTPAKAVVSELDKDDLDDAFQNDDDDDNDDDDNDDSEGKGDAKKKTGKKVEKADDNDYDNDDNDDDSQDDDDNQDDDNNEDDDDKGENDDDSPVDVSDFLKARVELLLKKGEWKPFEFDGKKPDEIEWDEETFEEIELQQRAWAKDALKEELLDTFGPYGRDIAEYAANGGNPEDLIDIFKEQQEVKAIDISTEEGQKEIVFQYQTQILKRSPQRATKEIERAIADKLLEDDAKEAKEMIEGHLSEQAEALKTQQAEAKAAFERQTKANQKKFVDDVTEIVNKADDIPVDEKKEVLKLLTNFRHELPNGAKVNDFYYKLAEFRKDLKNYVNMVRFVNNPERFMKSLKNDGKTQEAEKSFRLARGSQSKKKAKPSTEIGGDRAKKSTGFRLMT